MCYNRPQRYSSRLLGHTFIIYFHALFVSFRYNCQHINVSCCRCTIEKFYKMYTNSCKTCFSLHANFSYVHEKAILLGRSRLRALVVLVFAHDMQTQVAHGVCKQGCRLISYTVNKRVVTIDTCYNCPGLP